MANTRPVRPTTLPFGDLSGALAERTRGWLASLTGEPLVVIGLVAVALVAHGLNMFNFPSLGFTDDEGIYTSQAWAVLREGRLSPYTYFYDHVPGGWIQLAGWMGLTGGPLTFGGAIESGRMLMLLLHLAMVPLLYHLARKLGCGVPAAALAVLLFSLSPLAVFYQRLVLLDTIMLFWALLSLDLLLNGWGSLSRIVLSGICFGIAFLSKETAVFLVPAFLFIAVQDRRRHQGSFAVGGWLVPMLLVASLYPLYALLKHELLPSGGTFNRAVAAVEGESSSINFVFNGGSDEHVSLLQVLFWQLTRGGGGPFNLDNDFWQLARGDWFERDPLLLIGGAIAVGINLLRGIRDRRALAAALLGVLPLLYLARGGVVFGYYILFAIPFFCLNLAVLISPLLDRLPTRARAALAGAGAVALVAGYWGAGMLLPLYQQQPSEVTRAAVAWTKENVPAESLIIARDDVWTDLRERGHGGPGFPNVHSHWKVAQDPAVRTDIFQDDWRTADYLLISDAGQMRAIFQDSGNSVALEALNNAKLIRSWNRDFRTLELWKVNKSGAMEAAMLAESTAFLSRRFERNGAFVDLSNSSVTSEAQSYAMLRAVWSNDRATFDRAWGWTRDNLLTRDGLPAWLWRDGQVVDANSAADADVDIALALLLAGRRWNDPVLLRAGEQMVRAIWDREVVVVNGRPHLTAGTWATGGSVLALNPSYFSPHAYTIFATVDPAHNWTGLIESGYRLVDDTSKAIPGSSGYAGLPPDWIGLDRATGQLRVLELERGDTTRYGYDAARTLWRIALHLRWNGDGRAEAYLRNAGNFLLGEVRAKGYVSAVYAHNGEIIQEPPSLVGIAGALAALLTLDPDAANTLHARHLVAGAQRTDAGVSWGDPDDLYAQEWGWFATALYADTLSNLWSVP